MTTHDIRHKLTLINKRLLLVRALSTQVGVIQEVDQLVIEICALGDRLEDKVIPEKEYVCA